MIITLDEINYSDIKVIAVANKMVLVNHKGVESWMFKSDFNKISEVERYPHFKNRIGKAFGMVDKRVTDQGKTYRLLKVMFIHPELSKSHLGKGRRVFLFL